MSRGRPRIYTPEQAKERLLLSNKRWKKRNPVLVRKYKNDKQDRDQDATLLYAENSHTRWDSGEVCYLRLHSKSETAVEIALDLGRTYLAVIMRAHNSKIRLQTDDKLHGLVRM